MKTLIAILLGLGMAGALQAQAPQTGAAQVPAPALTIQIQIGDHLKEPLAQLQAIKNANQALLEKQAKTLQALEELQKQADELKIFAKRS